MLGNPAADQALGPFLNPQEQALPDSARVVWRVCHPLLTVNYPITFEELWGETACEFVWPDNIGDICATEGSTVPLSDADRATSDMAYGDIGLTTEEAAAIVAFLKTLSDGYQP